MANLDLIANITDLQAAKQQLEVDSNELVTYFNTKYVPVKAKLDKLPDGPEKTKIGAELKKVVTFYNNSRNKLIERENQIETFEQNLKVEQTSKLSLTSDDVSSPPPSEMKALITDPTSSHPTSPGELTEKTCSKKVTFASPLPIHQRESSPPSHHSSSTISESSAKTTGFPLLGPLLEQRLDELLPAISKLTASISKGCESRCEKTISTSIPQFQELLQVASHIANQHSISQDHLTNLSERVITAGQSSEHFSTSLNSATDTLTRISNTLVDIALHLKSPELTRSLSVGIANEFCRGLTNVFSSLTRAHTPSSPEEEESQAQLKQSAYFYKNISTRLVEQINRSEGEFENAHKVPASPTQTSVPLTNENKEGRCSYDENTPTMLEDNISPFSSAVPVANTETTAVAEEQVKENGANADAKSLECQEDTDRISASIPQPPQPPSPQAGATQPSLPGSSHPPSPQSESARLPSPQPPFPLIGTKRPPPVADDDESNHGEQGDLGSSTKKKRGIAKGGRAARSRKANVSK